jgi:hypothetical protein
MWRFHGNDEEEYSFLQWHRIVWSNRANISEKRIVSEFMIEASTLKDRVHGVTYRKIPSISIIFLSKK